MSPTIRIPHTTCHQHTANTDTGYATERVDGQENYLFNILSNNTHFYTPTPKLNKQPSEMDLIGNHHRITFVYLQISTQKTLTNREPNIPCQRINNRYQVNQPIHSIAIDRGFQCSQQNGNFNRTQSYTQTPST